MERGKARLEKIAPKKFCCKWELSVACKYIGIILTVMMGLCIIATVLQTIGLNTCSNCEFNSWKHAYGYSVSACIYCCLMFLINLWFIWGVKKGKKSVVLSWVIISTVWLVQTTCLLIVLLGEYSNDTNMVVWVICLVCTVIVIATLAYFILAGYGYWIQLRNKFVLPATLAEIK